MAAHAQGSLRVRHGVWRVQGRVPVVGRLADVIAVRLGQLDQAERPVAELLAVAAPVDLAELEDRFGSTTLEALERCGVLRVVADGPQRRAELAHPLYGELLRDAMASMTRQRVLADHLDWLDVGRRGRRSGPGAPGHLEVGSRSTGRPGVAPRRRPDRPLCARLSERGATDPRGTGAAAVDERSADAGPGARRPRPIRGGGGGARRSATRSDR